MNRKPFLLLAVLLLFVLLVSTVGAQDSIVDQEVEEMIILEQEITPDGIRTIAQIPNKKDTYIASNRPNDNFGLQNDMRIGFSLTGSSLGAMRMLLQYQVQEYIPKGAVINNATLNIFLTGVTPAGDSSMGFKALYLTSDWSEKSVTWNSHQPQWGSEIGIGNASSQLGWHQANVTQLVNEWVNGGRTNYGFTLIGDEAPARSPAYLHHQGCQQWSLFLYSCRLHPIYRHHTARGQCQAAASMVTRQFHGELGGLRSQQPKWQPRLRYSLV